MPRLEIKAEGDEDAVVCTATQTFQLKTTDVSDSLYLIPPSEVRIARQRAVSGTVWLAGRQAMATVRRRRFPLVAVLTRLPRQGSGDALAFSTDEPRRVEANIRCYFEVRPRGSCLSRWLALRPVLHVLLGGVAVDRRQCRS